MIEPTVLPARFRRRLVSAEELCTVEEIERLAVDHGHSSGVSGIDEARREARPYRLRRLVRRCPGVLGLALWLWSGVVGG